MPADLPAMRADHDTSYEWTGPESVRLSWAEDGSGVAELVIVCANGQTDRVHVVAVSRGRMLPAIVDVVDMTDAR